MEKDDLELLEKCACKHKIKYDELDCCIKDKVAGTVCYVPINLSSFLSDLLAFKESLVDDKGFDLHAAIACLNLYAHYKHYFMTRDARRAIIIGYVKDSGTYLKYKRIMDSLYDFSNFFPNIYTIPNISANGLFVHIVAATMCVMINHSMKNNINGIYVISNMNMDKQLMCCLPVKFATTLYKGYNAKTINFTKESYMEKIFKTKEYYDSFKAKGEAEYMSVLLGKYFNTMTFFKPKNKNENIELLHSRYADKLNIVSEHFLNNEQYDPEEAISMGLPNNMIVSFLLNLKHLHEYKRGKTDFKILAAYERRYDFHYQNTHELITIITPLLNNWKQKIKDYEISRQSENYKALISHQLYANWLS